MADTTEEISRLQEGDVAPAIDASLLIVDSLHAGLIGPQPHPDDSAGEPLQRPLIQDLRKRLADWERKYVKASSLATVKAVRADWGVFVCWCETYAHWGLPVKSAVLIEFLNAQVNLGKKRSTLDRYVNTIRTIHRAAGVTDPTAYPDWKLDWRGIVRALADAGANAPRQAEPMRSHHVDAILASLGREPMDLRDAALISLASDSLCRQSELVAFRLEDFSEEAVGWTAKVRSSKTDQEGLGQYRYVSNATMARIHAWCTAAGIKAGYVFRRIGLQDELDSSDSADPMRSPEVARIIRRRAVRAGISVGVSMSGHSGRVGSAIELIESGASMVDTQFAGGWKGAQQVLRYAKRAMVGRGAMSKLRKSQRRDDD